jgi:hypothetical protein
MAQEPVIHRWQTNVIGEYDLSGILCTIIAATPRSRRIQYQATHVNSEVTCKKCLHKMSPNYSRSRYVSF